MLLINSPDNAKLKHVRALLSQAKYRQKEGEFVLETARAIKDYIAHSPKLIQSVLFQQIDRGLLKLLEQLEVPHFQVAPHLFRSLHTLKASAGIVAVVKQRQWTVEECLKNMRYGVYLHHIANPSNLGGIIRSAVAFDMDGIVISDESTDPYHPRAIRAMAGNAFQVPFATSSLAELSKKAHRFTAYMLDPKGETSIQNLSVEPESLFIIGPERGINKSELLPYFPLLHTLKIPMHHEVDSLNVSASTSILLHTIFQQRQSQG